MAGNNKEQLIAVDQLTGVIHHHHAVAVTIKGNTKIGFFQPTRAAATPQARSSRLYR